MSMPKQNNVKAGNRTHSTARKNHLSMKNNSMKSNSIKSNSRKRNRKQSKPKPDIKPSHIKATKQTGTTVGRSRKQAHPAREAVRRRQTGTKHNHGNVRKPSLSVVIPASGRVSRLPKLVQRLCAWPAVQEVIVVANHCSKQTVAQVIQLGAQVISYKERLGHDTGRAIGALAAKGKYVLFLDADINWQIAELRPFLSCLHGGADIALNRYPLPSNPRFHHPTAVVKRALNLALDKPQLKAASMTTVPNAVRRSVIEQVGARYLAVPPVFFTRAVLRGYRVKTAAHAAVGARNPQPLHRPYTYNVQDLILGDHAEAFHTLTTELGTRGFFPDTVRGREVLPPVFVEQDGDDKKGSIVHAVTSLFRKQKDEATALTLNDEATNETLVVIPAYNESRTIGRVIRKALMAAPSQVHVVDNGSTDQTTNIAKRLGAKVHNFDEALGHDVPRAIGVAETAPQNAAATLFLDGDLPVQARHLRPFLTATRTGRVDVALNHLTRGLSLRRQRDEVSTMKRCLNLMVHRPDLGVSSATAVPLALSRQALAQLSPLDLAVPPRITVQAVLQGLSIKPVHYVDVISSNPKRRMNRPVQRHAPRTSGLSSPLCRLIIGDHLEALSLWFATAGPRGGFTQPRRLDLLEEAARQHESSSQGERT